MPNEPTTRNKIRTTYKKTNGKPAAKQGTNLNGYEKINLLIVMAIFMDKKFFKNIGITPRFFGSRIKGSLYQKPGDFIVEEILKKSGIGGATPYNPHCASLPRQALASLGLAAPPLGA